MPREHEARRRLYARSPLLGCFSLQPQGGVVQVQSSSVQFSQVQFSSVKFSSVLPWSSLDEGPDSFFNWVENLSSDINSRVLKGISDSISLGAIAFNDQVKIVRRMLAEHPVASGSLSTSSALRPRHTSVVIGRISSRTRWKPQSSPIPSSFMRLVLPDLSMLALPTVLIGAGAKGGSPLPEASRPTSGQLTGRLSSPAIRTATVVALKIPNRQLQRLREIPVCAPTRGGWGARRY